MAEPRERRALLEFDPHWFRRAVHAAGAAFVLYYLLPPGHPVAGLVRRYLPGLALAAFSILEAVRMSGAIKTEHFFGLREYERSRVSGYIYFGAATVLLLYLFPQAVAVPSIVGAAIGDPLVGELRGRGLPGLSLVTGVVFGAGLYAVAGWTPPIAILAGLLMTVGESTRFRLLDDDFIMPMVPALTLYALHAAGLLPVPAPLIHPVGGGA